MRTEISTLFELPAAPRRPENNPSQDALSTGLSSSALPDFAAPALSTPSVAVSPGPRQATRVFKNITDVGESSLFDEPPPPAEAKPTEPEVAKTPISSEISADIADIFDDFTVATTPTSHGLIEAADPKPDSLRARLRHKLAEDRAQAERSGSNRTALFAPHPPDEIQPEQDTQEEPPQDTQGERLDEPRLKFEASDHQGPWELRVDDLRYDPVNQDGLAILLKTGIWADALELLTESGHWVPLSRHPIYPAVRKILMRQTQEIVAQVSTGEWSRQVEDSPLGKHALEAPRLNAPTPEIAEPAVAKPEITEPSEAIEASPQAPLLTDLLTEPIAESSAPPTMEALSPERPSLARRSAPTSLQKHPWLPGLVPSVIALLTGILFGLLALLILYPNIFSEILGNDAALTSNPVPEEHPTLIIPLRSEPDDMSAEIAMARARTEVSRAHGVIRFSRGLLAADQPKLARQVVLDAMVVEGVRPDLKEAFNQAIAADPALHAAPLTLAVDEPIQQIFPLGGGRSISLRITQAGGKQYSYKPAQDEWGQGWRGELGAYLFCEIVPCHFVSPRNQAARISRSHFEAYYSASQSDWRASYAERFDAIHWVREPGPDGVVRDYMYGTFEDWVPHYVEWPIEYTQVYEDLLDIRFHPDDLNIPYSELLEPFKTLGGGRFHGDLLADQGDATTRDIARQLSSLLVFDYLTLNWDRFSSTDKYYGVNNQFADGIFVSIDNGASFTDQDVAKTVSPRFELTSRFSRSMVTAVRALDPAVVDEVLFPNPNLNARRRLNLFWRQRDSMLKRVDALIEKYGSERVYEFK